MSITLDPIVANKLRQFGQRRRRLIIARGICVGVVTLVVLLAVVATVDWYWLLSDGVRWGLSAAIYAAVIVVTWITCLRKLMKRPATEEIASQVELSEPQLRENLLSAVELATDDPSSLHDSPVFRSLLQGRVAMQMARIEVPNLLPMKLVGKWFLAAVAVLLMAALLLSGDARFRQLAARALLPGANIARVSRVNVQILQPTPHSLMLAEDETVAVVVAVTGGRFDEVTLETFTAKQGAVRQPMRNRTESEFASNIHVMNETVEYRILAGDAMTQRFTIEARPRPRVTVFKKTYEFPAYALLSAQTVTETHGDLLVLQGTKAEMSLELDQPVSAAELRIDPSDSDEMVVIPLTPDADSKNGLQLKATVPVDTAAIYKVHLVSKETGFENIFSPKYEIRPQPDLIPRAGFVDQQETTLMVPPNDIVALKAMAEDDLPLVSLEQHVSVNGRDWVALSLDAKPGEDGDGRHLTAEWQWDLLNHKLKTGDQVMTKLVATDRKGNIGESVPLRILVAAPDFDPERHTIMERKAGLVDELVKFATFMQEQKTAALEAVERLRKPEQTAEQALQDRSTLADLANKQRDRAATVLDEIMAVEKVMPAGADAYELDLTGRVIARIQREHSNIPLFVLMAMQPSDDANRRNADLEEMKRTFERTADDAKTVAEQYQIAATHNLGTAIAVDMNAMLRQQKLVVESSTQTWDRLHRHETIVINQFKDLERLIRAQRRRMPNYLDGAFNDLLTWSERNRSSLQDAMESEDQLEKLKAVSQDVLRQLTERQRYDNVDGNLPNRLMNLWRDFDNRAGNLYMPLEQLARAIQQENQLTAQASSSSDSAASAKLFQQAERFVAEVDLKQRRSMDQLRSRRELTQGRKDGDGKYAADAGLTHRAAVSLLNQHREVPPSASTIAANLLEVAPAYRILEAGHDLTIARDTLDTLTNLERWDSQELQARIEHPRQWDLVQRGFELGSQRLREAGVHHELVGKLDQVRWSAAMRDAGRKISERRWKRETLVGAGHELVQLREDLAKALADLEPVMVDARAIIAKYAPSIPQMAAQTADQIRELEEATAATADAIENKDHPAPVEQPKAEQLAELEQTQESINQQIADLTEALVEDANAQDMLEESERERARDADDSIAMIQEPAAQMNRAMEKAQETSNGEQQAKDLAQAAEQQEKTAKALELVAEHFDQLDKGLNIADTRAELRQVERDLGIARQMDQQYDGTDELSQMAEKNAQELIADLEKELQQNPAMQKALSEISQSTLQEARNALEYAAQDEKGLQQSNERADEVFQSKKRDIAEDLREVATQASQLANAVVAQASQSAAQGKTTEAQQKFSEAQQKLNSAAVKASSANENQLLAELAQTAEEAKAALAEASELLTLGKQQTQTSKDEKIHADDNAREAQRKDSQNRRQQFHDQQKRSADDKAKRSEDVRKRSEQAVQNAERVASEADKRLQQATDQLNAKPDDAGLKNNVAREQGRQLNEQKKLARAKDALQQASERVQNDVKRAEEVKNKTLPVLDAQNPAAQLADQFAEEALKAADELRVKAEQLSASANFGSELTPQKNQLASAEQQQKEVTRDVTQAAEDVSRVARHGRRLNNPAVAQPLQTAASDIQQVARGESAAAEEQLKSATSEAEQAEGTLAENPSAAAATPNSQSLEAQKDLATAEKAIARQASQLSSVLDPLLAAAAARNDRDSNDSASANDAPSSGDSEQQAGQQQAGQQANSAGESVAGQPGSSQPAGGQPEGPPTGQAFSPEQAARGEQLAKTLDELDRQQSAATVNAAESGQQQTPQQDSPSRLDTLAQAARSRQAAQAAARIRAQQQAVQALNEGGHESSDSSGDASQIAQFNVSPVNRKEGIEWGKLRNQSAEDLTKGKSEVVSEEYRKSVETYFRVLAERAKKKK